jgi:PHP family Zn ribbon phosphoesterase
VHWRCCSAYSRVYRNKAATAYEGRCPRCGKLVTIRIGAEGTAARFFEAY